PVLGRDVDGGPAETLAHTVAAHHAAGDAEGAAQHLRGILDPSFGDGAPDAGAGDPLAAQHHLGGAAGREAQLFAEAAQQLEGPLAPVAEGEALADVDLPRSQPPPEELAHE